MDGIQEIIGVCLIDKKDQSHVVRLDENKPFTTADKAAIIGNVYYPFAYYKAMQVCDEKLLQEFKQYL